MSSTETDLKLTEILTKLKTQIDGLNTVFETVRGIILQLAKFLDKTKHCETNEICSLIKKMLADKIKEAKITARWIEDCLPKEYKRKYAKSELTSHLTTGKINQSSAGQQIVQEVQRNQSIADSQRNNNDEEPDKKHQSDIQDENGDLQQENADLKEALLKAKTFRNALNLEHKFEVHKDKLIEIIDRLKNCGEKCYLIFNEQGTLVRIEVDNLTDGDDSEQ